MATTQTARWGFSARLGFRFVFAYITLFSLAVQIGESLFALSPTVPNPNEVWPLNPFIAWISFHLLNIRLTAAPHGMLGWLTAFWALGFAATAVAIWSVLDRKRQNYVTLGRWFHLCLRFALADQLILYGLAKILTFQMPFPGLLALVKPFGDFVPMEVLWNSVGSSPAYEVFTGGAEMLAGILLLLPATAVLGALIAFVDLTMVFVLNLAYDVNVKLISFHLLFIAALLLAPELSRLMDFFVLNRAVLPSTMQKLVETERAQRILFVAQALFGVWLLVSASSIAWVGRTMVFARPSSPLYGIWDIEEISFDGKPPSTLLADYKRWHRAIFEYPEMVAFQAQDEVFSYYTAGINPAAKTLVLTLGATGKGNGKFTFTRPAEDQCILDGTLDSRPMRMRLRRLDRSQFALVKRGFHWIQ